MKSSGVGVSGNGNALSGGTGGAVKHRNKQWVADGARGRGRGRGAVFVRDDRPSEVQPSDPFLESQESRDLFWHTLVKSREAERLDLICRGLMDDPLVPKRLSDAITLVGTCADMCPRFERYRRERENNLFPWECLPAPHGKRVWHGRAVKAYERAAGDKTLPSDLRPPGVLKRTLDYLFGELMVREGFVRTYAFLRDRTRAVRSDFVMQREEGAVAVECHERCVRFHIVALREMRGEKEFSVNLEEQQLMNTLQSLKEFYTDQRSVFTSPNELEMWIYHRLIHIRDQRERNDDIPSHILTHPVYILTSAFRAHVQAQSTPITKTSPLVVGEEGMRIFGELAGWLMGGKGKRGMVYLVACLLEHLFGRDRIEDMESVRGGLALVDIIDGREQEQEQEEPPAPPAPSISHLTTTANPFSSPSVFSAFGSTAAVPALFPAQGTSSSPDPINSTTPSTPLLNPPPAPRPLPISLPPTPTVPSAASESTTNPTIVPPNPIPHHPRLSLLKTSLSTPPALSLSHSSSAPPQALLSPLTPSLKGFGRVGSVGGSEGLDGSSSRDGEHDRGVSGERRGEGVIERRSESVPTRGGTRGKSESESESESTNGVRRRGRERKRYQPTPTPSPDSGSESDSESDSPFPSTKTFTPASTLASAPSTMGRTDEDLVSRLMEVSFFLLLPSFPPSPSLHHPLTTHPPTSPQTQSTHRLRWAPNTFLDVWRSHVRRRGGRVAGVLRVLDLEREVSASGSVLVPATSASSVLVSASAPSTLASAYTLLLVLNPAVDATAIWAQTKFGVPGSGWWGVVGADRDVTGNGKGKRNRRKRNAATRNEVEVFEIPLLPRLSTPTPSFTYTSPALIIFELTPLAGVRDELERKYVVLRDCTRLRGVLEGVKRRGRGWRRKEIEGREWKKEKKEKSEEWKNKWNWSKDQSESEQEEHGYLKEEEQDDEHNTEELYREKWFIPSLILIHWAETEEEEIPRDLGDVISRYTQSPTSQLHPSTNHPSHQPTLAAFSVLSITSTTTDLDARFDRALGALSGLESGSLGSRSESVSASVSEKESASQKEGGAGGIGNGSGMDVDGRLVRVVEGVHGESLFPFSFIHLLTSLFHFPPTPSIHPLPPLPSLPLRSYSPFAPTSLPSPIQVSSNSSNPHSPPSSSNG
ncbi:MAG: SAC3/GANP/Nin1/mts3/eIF-3 p25 family-domain-containing protein [Lentinula lateritia]|nr:MAG: SAC3/GANP/Nin1/mts3/eIF-3 p25 family-domain-containing protein [Lentinula lateritia]